LIAGYGISRLTEATIAKMGGEVLLSFALARSLGRRVIKIYNLCLNSAYIVSMVSFLYKIVGKLI
jgi:hypothetical protein